jgi:predicted nucleic acid-binding protein
LARVSKAETKPLAILDSNVIVYSMITDYPNKPHHRSCRTLLEKGLKGELDHILSLNPIVIFEVFSALKTLLNRNEAEYRTSSLLRSNRIAYLSISKEASQNSVQWAKEKKIPVNDAMIGASMVEQANLIYTVDEDHFKKLEEYGVKILNPIRP